MIDAALCRIAQVAGVRDAAKLTLERVKVAPKADAWDYLMDAMTELRPQLTGRVPEAGWGSHFLSGTHLTDFPELPKKKRYPREAHPAIDQKMLVGGYDADVVLLWRRRDGHVSVCHAHPEGFWVLGHDVVDFVERAASEAEGTPSEDIVDDEVEALADGKGPVDSDSDSESDAPVDEFD